METCGEGEGPLKYPRFWDILNQGNLGRIGYGGKTR